MWCVVSLLLASSPVSLSALENEQAVAEALWANAPSLQSVRADVARAVADAQKAQRLPNPQLDVGLNTLPIGPSNPTDLKDPWLNVPNLAVGVSVLLELGKRGPRQEATQQAARAASLTALETLRQKVFELEDVMGDVAGAQVRVDYLTALVDDATRLSTLQRQRAEKGDASELDADRAQLELEGALSLLGDAREEQAERIAACSLLLGVPCLPFDSVRDANGFLDRAAPVNAEALAQRSDLEALDASARSARAAQALANAGWLPDPTVRVGYVRDQFVISGNQQNSLFVGVSLPLPLFEHGQDDAAAAGVAAQRAERQREQLLESARTQLEQLDGQVTRATQRQDRLRARSLPLARGVVERLSQAVNRGAATIEELLLARRSLVELSLSANELDRSLFHLHVARARLGTSLRALPESP